MKEYVILVDSRDRELGTKEKLKAHRDADLHRCFSVIIFNSKGEMLLQRRAVNKYHSPGLWTNACCSHQRPGESSIDAANRRLNEELGIKCSLEEKFNYTYKAKLDRGMNEHEFDHVFIGYSDIDPVLNLDEADAFKWISQRDLKKDIASNPSSYTVWFRIIHNEMTKRKMI